MSDSVMISLRINRQLLERIDALSKVFEHDPALAPSGITTRADVLRYLLLKGVQSFDGEESYTSKNELVIMASPKKKKP